MSSRGRAFFDRYVKANFTEPFLAWLPVETQVFNLSSEASAAKIPLAEVIEEVGPLRAALINAKRHRS